MTESAPTPRVLALLAQVGVFRLGGVLVGTQAFSAYGNMLGVRFEQQALRTQDIDIAQDRSIGIALSIETAPLSVEEWLSTSFTARGRDLRVDFLTPSLDRFLDYLIESPAQAVVVSGSGVLVNVPDPGRFAFHKLWISERRPVSEQTKATKDRRQAGALLEVLLRDRPGDVLLAWDALQRSPAVVKTVRKAMDRLSPELRMELPGS